ncbi:fimbrillin family protein, partial [Bacteroides sp. OttesenSCG-928-D19]|nr:fimbrillin family protein [Bacteroides sp. OttesenSCG-928-D19]
LAAGTSNTLTLTLSIAQDGKTVAGVEAKMKEWETGADKALTAVNLVIPTNPNTNAPEVTTFTLYKNKGAAGEVSVNYTYNAGTSAWETSGGLPFYVEDIVAADKFTAVHTPTAEDAITKVKDILQTGEAGMNMGTGIINLTFAHVNAKVSIVLKKGEGLPAGTNLATATVNFQGYTFTGEKTMLVAPATIAAGAQVATIAVGGHTYTVKTAAAITLAAGTQTVLTFTLIPSEAGISIGTADWGAEVKSGFDAQVDVTSGSDFSKLPAAGTVKITTGAFTGEYHWSGTTLTVVTPIYWDELSNAIAHNFALEFTPDADGAPEKDVLIATANGVAWGMGIDFTNLTHKYAQFTVVLKKGTGYTDAEFTAAAAAATVSLVGFSAANHDTTNGTASIVKPQTLTANHKVSVNIGDNTYGMDMKGIFAGNVLEANKRYTLEATVNKNGTGISIGVIEDWGNGGTGSGELVH